MTKEESEAQKGAQEQMDAAMARQAEWQLYRKGVVEAINKETELIGFDAKISLISNIATEMILRLANAQAKEAVKEAIQELKAPKIHLPS